MSLIHSDFNGENSILYKLENLYEKYGYVKLKTSKFEKYDFYINNKYFLNSSGMITFTDIHGDLLALKPDNTFSIAKSLRVGLDEVKKYTITMMFIDFAVKQSCMKKLCNME